MRRLLAALFAFAGLGCADGVLSAAQSMQASAAAPESIEAMHYAFSVDETLSVLTAKLCFRGPPPTELICGEHGGAGKLEGAELATAENTRALPVKGGRIQLASLPPDACLRYRVRLGEAGDRYGDAVLTSVTEWLWRPPHQVRVGTVTADFQLPQGAELSVPWPLRDGRYRLDQTSFGFKAYAAFGRFERERIEVAGVNIDVAILDGLPSSTRGYVRPWIGAAARAAALATGRFPRDRLQVIVIPAGPGEAPVGFGQMNRGGGASAVLFLRENARLDALLGSWVAVHEFSHLLHPFIDRDSAWLSEGIATYYQEVLRVRAGVMSEREAWQRLYAGALRGRGTHRSLAEESAEMYVTRAFPTVYWAGAAIALMADVELRTAGEGSLDGALRELSRCCARTARPWTARRMTERFDRIVGAPVLGALVRDHVRRPPLPRLGPLLARLGVVVEGDDVRLDESAELAHVRRAIMRVDPDEAARTRALRALAAR